MKKRLLSLILTACMLLGMLPGAALAEETTVTVDTVQKHIFANGLAITLQAKGTGTEILVDNAAVTLEGLTDDATNGYDLSDYTIIGGSQNANVDSTSITMEGGTVQTIFGGGMLASGGTVSANVTGAAELSITGGTVTAAVRAGGYDQNAGATSLTATVGSATVAIGGTAEVTNKVELGGAGTTPAKVKVVGDAFVKLSGSPKIGSGTGSTGTGIVIPGKTKAYIKVTGALTDAVVNVVVPYDYDPIVLIESDGYALTEHDVSRFVGVGSNAYSNKGFALNAQGQGIYHTKLTERYFTEFSFGVEGEDVVIGRYGDTTRNVTVKLPYGTAVTTLKPTFTLSLYAKIKMGETPQVSGQNTHDFTSPVTYTITAENGKTMDYEVSVFVFPFPRAGTVDDPYLIEDEADLFALAAELEMSNIFEANSFEGKFLKLTQDIALIKDWETPHLYYNGDGFRGTLDGDGHVISNVHGTLLGVILGGDAAGSVKNLGVNVAIDASGGEGGDMGGIAGILYGTVENCFVTGTISGGGYSAAVGGLVGNNMGTITNCYTNVIVTGSGQYVDAGGLVGENNGSVTNCYAAGAVTATGSGAVAGGFVGSNKKIYSGTGLVNCYWNTTATTEGAGETDKASGEYPAPAAPIGKTADEMKLPAFLTALNDGGSAFVADEATPVNDGFPILSWQTGPIDPPPPATVLLGAGSLGVAGDKTITGLTVGKIYAVQEGTDSPTLKYISPDGKLKLSEVSAGPLEAGVTSLTGLTNGTTYTVKEAAVLTMQAKSMKNTGTEAENDKITLNGKGALSTNGDRTSTRLFWPGTEVTIQVTAGTGRDVIAYTDSVDTGKGVSDAKAGYQMTMSASRTVAISFTAPLTVDGSNIYANGNPLVIEAGTTTGYTNVFLDQNDNQTKDDGESWLTFGDSQPTAAGYDLSDVRFFGGSGTKNIVANPKITMTGGKVYFIVGGGNNKGTVTGNSSVTVRGGEVNSVYKGNVTGEFALTLGGAAKVEALTLGDGISDFAVSPAFTGEGIVNISLARDYDASGKPTVATGAIAADMSHIKMLDGLADFFSLTLEGSAVKIAPLKLATPTNLRWDSTSSGLACWDEVEGTYVYYVLLYKDGEAVGEGYPSNPQIGCAKAIAKNGAGSYTFTVEALTGYPFPGIDSERATSPAYVYETHEVSGGVQDENKGSVKGATVRLMLGYHQIGATQTTGDDGTFTIEGVPNGVYNLVTSKEGVTVTTVVEVKDGDKAVGKITLPTGKLNTVVAVEENAPAVVADGLSGQISEEDKEYAKTPSNSVEIKLVVKEEQTGEEATAVADKIAVDGLESAVAFDLSLVKTMTGTTTSETTMPVAAALLTLRVPIPGAALGKTDYKVYRSHDGSVDVLATTSNPDGEKIEVVGTTLILTVKKFSAYAIAYSDAITPEPPSDTGSPVTTYAITATAGEGGTISPKGTVRVSRNGSKVFTITPDKGYVLAQLLVDGTDVGRGLAPAADGSTVYTFEKVTAKHSIEVQFRKEVKNPFTDVSEENWFYDAVQDLLQKGIMEGTASDKFSPYLDTSRGMIVTILWRLEGEPAATAVNPFADVSADAYCATAIAWGAENGIVKGYGNGSFGPDDSITREQLATILWRYAGSEKVLDYEGTGRFTDTQDISSWAAHAVTWALSEGILTGKENGILDPGGKAIRAETAVMLERFMSE